MKIKPTYVPFLAMHLLSFIMEGQVGIKTQNPQATLDAASAFGKNSFPPGLPPPRR